ncbi:MAG TPA: contractile injection system tape measure protein [Candidatus Didemnitutus sp.]|nr:contractile injection system tape measure protein [Candidatus Didemnitutus sp.]
MNELSPHVVATHAIQIEMDRENGARAIMELAAVLGRGQLADETEELFSAYAPPNRRVQIERIELALGTIPEEQFATEFPARFRAALQAELERRLGWFALSDTTDDEASRRTVSLLDTLEHVLLHGALPWWSPQEADFDPVAVIDEELRFAPGRLRTLLRRIGRHQRVRTRLVQWLADPQIVALIRTLAPADAGFIERYAADLETRHREEPLVPADSEEFRAAKWEVILAHLLTDHGSAFNAKSFLRRTLERLAAHFGVDYTELLAQLARMARAAEKHWGESSLPRLLTEIHAEDVLGVEASPSDLTVDEAVARWDEELARPANSSDVTRRGTLILWRKLSPADLLEVVKRLVVHHGLAAVAARLALLFDAGARSELHRLLRAAGSGGASFRPEETNPVRASGIDENSDDEWRRDLAVLTGVAREDEKTAGDSRTEPAALPALRAFLETGRLPGGAWTRNRVAWLLVALAEMGEAALPLLRTWAQSGRLAPLMSRNLDDALLEAVVETVEPANADAVLEFIRTVDAAREEAFPTAVAATELHQETWRVTLDYLLGDRGSVFSRREFLRRSVHEFAGRHGIAPGVLLEVWSATAQSSGHRALAEDLAALRADHARLSAAQQVESGEPSWSSGDEVAAGNITEITLRRSRFARLRLLREMLRDAATPRGVARPELLRVLWELFRKEDTAESDTWRELLRRSEVGAAVEVMLASQGEDVLAAAVFAGEPAQAEIWRESVAWLEQSSAAAALFPGGRQGLRARLWRALLARWRAGGGRPVRDIAALLVTLLLEVNAPGATHPSAAEASLRETLRTALARDGSHGARRLAAEIHRSMPRSVSPPARPPRRAELPPPPVAVSDAPIAVSNAGLVLLAPFFVTLHDRCGLLDGEKFRDFHANQRAVQLLQYLVTGGRRTHEYSLVLNKILCGLNPELPVVPEIELTGEEMQAANALLQSVADRWPRGAAISPDGIRGSYLWRPGVLKRRERAWELWVERRGWDILLPELPWGFSIAQSAWMPEPLRVDWI